MDLRLQRSLFSGSTLLSGFHQCDAGGVGLKGSLCSCPGPPSGGCCEVTLEVCPRSPEGSYPLLLYSLQTSTETGSAAAPLTVDEGVSRRYH